MNGAPPPKPVLPKSGLPKNVVALPAPDTPEAPKKSKIELLLDCEAAMRDVSDAQELSYLIVNEWRQLVPAQQIFLFEPDLRGKFQLTHASDVTKPDPRAPLCRNLADMVAANRANADQSRSCALSLDTLDTGGEPFAFKHALLHAIGHAKSAKERYVVTAFANPPGDGDRVILDRLAPTAAHAFALQDQSGSKPWRTRLSSHRMPWLLLAAVLLFGMIPVPMSVLAPVEIIAADPFIAAAPLDGVIKSIDVEPDSPVQPGDILFHMHDSELRSSYEVARKSADVAQARWRRAQQGASVSPELRREAGLAEAEYAAAAAQRDATLAKLERSIVKAEASGTAMFNNKSDWVGKPVSTGERIIEIADPSRIEAHIELGLADSVVLDRPEHVTLFMDSNPLSPVDATYISAAYRAVQTRNNTLAFTVRAAPQPQAKHILRIGQRGTAQIRSTKVSLAYFLLRRPLSMLRQRIGL